MALDDHRNEREPHLYELMAVGDTAPVDVTRGLLPETRGSWPPRLLDELPRISVIPANASATPTEDLVAERVLGEGGMGVVTLCHQRSLSREVAVKTVRPGDSASAAVRALVDEARITGALEHPGIVPVHALGMGPDGLPMLVMKRVTGVVWRDLVRNPAHPAWTKMKGDWLTFHLDVLRRVCEAVHFAHSRGVVHRDLKTANVMIGEFGEVYVLDWGIACNFSNHDGTEHQQLIGTPSFMAPEMLSGGQEPLTPRTDVYLLGGMLHEVLTGQPRHEGKTLLLVLYNAWHSEPFDYPASVPRELAALCNRAMHRDPSKRVPDARAFAEALMTFHEHRASERLTEAAYERLSALKALVPGSDHATAQRLWTEASFGFRQAIGQWPESLHAHEGRREGTVLMIRHELASRNAQTAQELLATLDAPPEALTAEVAQLRDELAAEAAEVAQLRELARELDIDGSARERARAAVGVAFAAAAVLIAIAALRGHEALVLTHGTLSLFLATLTALSAAFTWWRRDVLLANRAGRRLTAMPFVALAGAFVSLWMGDRLDLPASASVLTGLLVTSAVFSAMGLAFDRRLLVVSGTTLLATMIGAAFPAHVFDVAAVAAVAGLGASLQVALLFRVAAEEAEHPERPPVHT